MRPKQYKVIGLMSGTSLDGLDIAFCQFEHTDADGWRFELIAADTRPYDETWKRRLARITEVSGEELISTHQVLGSWMGQAVKAFMDRNQLDPEFVASHGHTVFHQPENGFTYQMGSSFALHVACGKPVISNFRDMDLALGGQGAPLVPIGDQLLFGHYQACVNIGGISNISAEVAGRRVAYDMGPANMALNHFAQKLGKDYDPDGSFARSGKVQWDIFDQLNGLTYYEAPFPKSLGYEWVSRHIIQPLEQLSLRAEDALATLTHHAARLIADNIRLMLQQKGWPEDAGILLSGGGAYNSYLLECIREYSQGDFKIIIPNELIVSYREALIFAFLGVLKIRGEINCLSSVTGAAHDHSAGVLYGK
ncbi:MAG: anhydro-N-acetylmuramic acid kinase [Cyclobacteriaceae bacterium]